MGSWVVQFLWWLYITVKLEEIPQKEKRYYIQAASERVSLVNYSDDHLLKIPCETKLQNFFSYTGWVEFMAKWFQMKVRDIYQFNSVYTTVRDGLMIKRGPCFLQHFAILNPLYGRPGQPKSLPYRPTDAIIIRLAIGREPKARNLLDLLLACLGHAYGTYAGNLEAYDIIEMVYSLTLSKLPPGTNLSAMLVNAEPTTLAKFRLQNVSDEELLQAFPP